MNGTSSLNWTHIKRIAWKDRRRIGALWIVLVGFWLLWLVAIAWLANSRDNFAQPFTFMQTASGMAWTVVIYGMAWAGITYSLEHEEKTFGFLRSLPVNNKNVFYGKLMFGVTSIVAMTIVMAGMAWLYHWSIESLTLQPQRLLSRVNVTWHDLAIGALVIPIATAAGLFWSVRTKRPMRAIAAAVVSLYALACLAAVASQLLNEPRITPAKFVPRMAIASVVLTAVFFALSLRHSHSWLYATADAFKKSPRGTATSQERLNRGKGFSRLLWLQQRQSWMPIASFVFGCGWLVFVVVRILMATMNGRTFTDTSHFESHTGSPLIIACVCMYLGMIVFRREHREKRFRMLAQVGASPTSYWLSHLLFPTLATMSLAAAWGVPLRLHWAEAQTHGQYSWEWLFFPGFCLAFFSLAQFCSVAWRSTVLAWSATFVACTVASLWFIACGLLGVPVWLAVGPVVVLPLAASYLRVSRWFRATGSWRQWVIPALPIVLLATLPLVTAIYRGYEIPAVALDGLYMTAPTATAEDIASAKAFEDVFEKLPDGNDSSFDTDGAWSGENEEFNRWTAANPAIVEQLVAATNTGTALHIDEQAPFSFYKTPDKRIASKLSAVWVLAAAARQAENEGQLEEAWRFHKATLDFARQNNDGYSGLRGTNFAWNIERYVYQNLVGWAMHEDNTAERIQQALVELKEYRESQPSGELALTAQYRLERRSRFGSHEQFLVMGARESIAGGILQVLASISPWERMRSERMLDQVYLVESRMLNPGYEPDYGSDRRFERYARTTFSPTFFFNWERFANRHDHVRRGTICQLAAIAYHREHGEYPTDFSNVKIGGRKMYNDLLYRNAMCIGPDIVADSYHDLTPFRSDPVPGLFIRHLDSLRSVPFHNGPNQYFYRDESGSRIYVQRPTYSDTNTINRHFVLPDFDNWSREHFAARLEATSRDASNPKPEVE